MCVDNEVKCVCVEHKVVSVYVRTDMTLGGRGCFQVEGPSAFFHVLSFRGGCSEKFFCSDGDLQRRLLHPAAVHTPQSTHTHTHYHIHSCLLLPLSPPTHTGLQCVGRSMALLLLHMRPPCPSTPCTLTCGSAWATATCSLTKHRRPCRCTLWVCWHACMWVLKAFAAGAHQQTTQPISATTLAPCKELKTHFFTLSLLPCPPHPTPPADPLHTPPHYTLSPTTGLQQGHPPGARAR